MNQVLKLHKILKDLFQFRMDNKKLNLCSHWEEIGEGSKNISLREIPFTDLMVNTKGWNPNSQFKLLEEMEARISDNKATIQFIEEQFNQKDHTLIPSGSQVVNQPDSPVA
ncbi:hypothetical protein O181_028832 [Austropuccinia psidii MF-1]|uniref:Uncharacterized protein n=1 Tax=Austropuccinia psidii MF-1 TaxID=1389203 RepID=A0A9Q3H2Z6_9BASI|nr:hypothetical protein [Austropuccinia psidii MF-1]